MFHYYANYISVPRSKSWFEENGLCWAEGEVLVTDINTVQPIVSYPLPLMAVEDFNRFRTWLSYHQTDKLETLDKLLAVYHCCGNPQITWFND